MIKTNIKYWSDKFNVYVEIKLQQRKRIPYKYWKNRQWHLINGCEDLYYVLTHSKNLKNTTIYKKYVELWKARDIAKWLINGGLNEKQTSN